MAKEYTDTEICLKCVDENEILCDESGKYLDKITSTKLDCPETIYQDILRNLSKCKDVLLMSLKQRVIMNESGVRLNAKNDVAGMQVKIADINLPTECKNYLRDISIQGYQILKQNNFFDYLVEFDAERSANVNIFGKKAKTVGSFDILAIMDDKPLATLQSQQTKQQNLSRKLRKNLNTEKSEHKIYNDKAGAIDSDLNDINDISVTDTISEPTISSKSLGKAVLTVVITARNYINTLNIFRQFLFMHLQNLSRFFFLVFYIGPLVEKEEIVLYEYKPPKLIVKFVKSFRSATGKQRKGIENRHKGTGNPQKGTGNPQKETGKEDKETSNKLTSEPTEFIVSQTVQKSTMLGPEKADEITESYDLDVSQLEVEFRKVKGRHLQQSAPLRDYFRYIVYDCPGVKDHQKDKKARYDRYITKQEKRREAKLIKARQEAEEGECQREPIFTFESNIAVHGSTCIHIDQSDSQYMAMLDDKELLDS